MSELRQRLVAQAIRRHRLIVILRRIEPQEKLLALVDELADDGMRIFEITFDASSAAEDLLALRRRLDQRDDGPFVLGAGTLMDLEHLAAARAVGADFGVTPALELTLVAAAVEGGFPFMAGGMTPTEVHAAWSAGATFVKVFPASAVGPQFIRDVRGPWRDIEMIPTGGVDATNAAAFLDAGAVALGIGSALIRMSSKERRRLMAQIAK